MLGNSLKIKVDTQKIILSSESILYKTENFIKQTKYISNVDFFISKIAEGLLKNLSIITDKENLNSRDYVNCFCVRTEDNEFSFLVKLGYQVENANKKDIVFFEYIADYKQIRQNDQRLIDYLKLHNIINIVVEKNKKLVKVEDFVKLYLISNSSNVNLPKLSKEQKDIVETLDQNVLVQGVAGSGKTNICIDKIIYSSCRNYGGKILYSTYSRGLLMDTKLKIEEYKKDLIAFENAVKKNNVVFLDSNHKKALENKLGIFFFSTDDEQIFDKIHNIINFLNTKVDYFLIEDLYRKKVTDNALFADENYFIKEYIVHNKNHQLSRLLSKIEKYSFEVIYKEIYGMIFGEYSIENPKDMLSKDDYISQRKNSFSKEDCEIIYSIALDYKSYLKAHNLVDLNTASKILLKKKTLYEDYSLAILDEVQDFSQANLCLFKTLSLKLFCVGDALQMINPSFFSFGYLKNLLFEKDLISVKQLQSNYRNTKKIEEIIDSLGEINVSQFGTHNFVVKGKSIDTGVKTTAIYVNADNFAKEIANSSFDNFTFVVCSNAQKNNLKKIIKNQEILTISEVKGLERNTIVAYNLLSDNYLQWQALQRNKVNHKEADENSVYRYYYNLFYVGLTRAKQNLFVVESVENPLFSSFFKDNFDNKNTLGAVKTLNDIVSKIEFTQDEILDRVKEFIKLEQYDNAVFTANKIKDDVVRLRELNRIEINEKYIHLGNYREAGIKFWEKNMLDDAKAQFELSNDKTLIDLVDVCSGKDNSGLNIDIVDYYLDVKDNEIAKKFILETIKKDEDNLKSSFREIKDNLKKGGK